MFVDCRSCVPNHFARADSSLDFVSIAAACRKVRNAMNPVANAAAGLTQTAKTRAFPGSQRPALVILRLGVMKWARGSILSEEIKDGDQL